MKNITLAIEPIEISLVHTLYMWMCQNRVRFERVQPQTLPKLGAACAKMGNPCFSPPKTSQLRAQMSGLWNVFLSVIPKIGIPLTTVALSGGTTQSLVCAFQSLADQLAKEGLFPRVEPLNMAG